MLRAITSFKNRGWFIACQNTACMKFSTTHQLWFWSFTVEKNPSQKIQNRKKTSQSKNEKTVSIASSQAKQRESPEPRSQDYYSANNRPLGRGRSGSCFSWEALLGSGERRGMERVRKVLGVLHQLIGISDVCQAEPEDGPHPVNKAPVTMFKVPGRRERGGKIASTVIVCSILLL